MTPFLLAGKEEKLIACSILSTESAWASIDCSCSTGVLDDYNNDGKWTWSTASHTPRDSNLESQKCNLNADFHCQPYSRHLEDIFAQQCIF